MTLHLKINFTETLLSKELEYWVPHDVSNNVLENIVGLMKSWTENPNNPDKIYSGYRRQILSSEGLNESQSKAEQYRKKFKSLVVLGIGGSALGCKAVLEALQHSITDPRNVEVIDNLDPVEFERVWKANNPKETCYAVISKTGGTIETMAQTSLIVSRLQEMGLKTQEHLIAITDPQSGFLRQWVSEAGLDSLSVPSDVGGRFSVFSPVGLFPLAFAGINIQELILGAQKTFKGDVIDIKDLAVMSRRLAEFEWEGFSGHMLMPYASVLKSLSAWFVQLWGESLGKKSLKGNRVGPIPIAAVGATDQHSILQLLMEGPNRIVNGFVQVLDWNLESEKSVVMTSSLPSAYFSKLTFAQGSTFASILRAQSLATQSVLTQHQRPTYQIELGRLDEQHLGALMAFYMDLTSATGAALEVNPYDQPGVEEGKIVLPSFF